MVHNSYARAINSGIITPDDLEGESKPRLNLKRIENAKPDKVEYGNASKPTCKMQIFHDDNPDSLKYKLKQLPLV